MDIEIRSKSLFRTLYGLSGYVKDQDYAAAGLPLMDELWKKIEEKELQHKGINHWVYEAQDRVFVGVELEADCDTDRILERKEIVLPKYAYWKHVGAYTKLAEIHHKMHRELQNRGVQACRPSVEVYGHWAEDETKLETAVLICVE